MEGGREGGRENLNSMKNIKNQSSGPTHLGLIPSSTSSPSSLLSEGRYKHWSTIHITAVQPQCSLDGGWGGELNVGIDIGSSGLPPFCLDETNV